VSEFVRQGQMSHCLRLGANHMGSRRGHWQILKNRRTEKQLKCRCSYYIAQCFLLCRTVSATVFWDKWFLKCGPPDC